MLLVVEREKEVREWETHLVVTLGAFEGVDDPRVDEGRHPVLLRFHEPEHVHQVVQPVRGEALHERVKETRVRQEGLVLVLLPHVHHAVRRACSQQGMRVRHAPRVRCAADGDMTTVARRAHHAL